MNRALSGTVITWRTKNARKMKRAETWCADYGLAPIHKALHVGPLYAAERLALERKFKNLLREKQDRYCIIVLCGTCLKGLNTSHDIANIDTQYEIV